MAKKKAAVPKLDPAAAFRNLSAQGILDALKKWAITNRIYIIAFFIPIVIMYISYAIFGLYPFGEESVLVLDLNAQYVYYFEALRV